MTNSPISLRSGTPRVGWLFGALALLAVLAYLLGSNYSFIPGNWSFTKDARQFEGRFFRMVVKLDYQGKPQTFDFVVGCQVKSILYQDGSRSRDVGFIPAVYGRRMKDNKAVVIRPPDVCNGETSANGQVPPAFMPFIIVYDNADTLDAGLAYLSDDAYVSPFADLKFRSTDITPATREMFDEDGRTGIPNLITRERYWSYQGKQVITEQQQLKFTRPAFGKSCSYVARIKLPNAIGEMVRDLWPESRPLYWLPQSDVSVSKILEKTYGNSPADPAFYLQRDTGGQPYPATKFRQFDHTKVNFGMPRQEGPYLIAPTENSEKGNDLGPIESYYPLIYLSAESFWPKYEADWPTYVDKLFDPAFLSIETKNGKMRGFAACWSFPNALDEDLVRRFAQVPGHVEIDGIRVEGQPNEVINAFGNNITYLFENDEYLYKKSYFDFGVVGGDVR